MYLLALLRRSLLYIVVLALICWPRWVDGVDRNWEFKVRIYFLMVLRDWSYHLRAAFCFLVGGPFFQNLTACFVSSRIFLEKSSTMTLMLGLSALSLADRIWIFSLKWGAENLVWTCCMASGDQSNVSNGELVVCGWGL